MHLKRIDTRREIKKKETIEKILRGGWGKVIGRDERCEVCPHVHTIVLTALPSLSPGPQGQPATVAGRPPLAIWKKYVY